MKLQIAIDMTDTIGALKLLEKTAEYIDIVEVGTPMIVREGMVPVREIKKRWPNLTVLADVKIVDGGAFECQDAVDAGADIITVLAIADQATISEVVHVAHENGRQVMADLITVTDIPAKSGELQALGVDYICVHTGVDAQKSGRTPMSDLKQLLTVTDPKQTAVAGGINLKTLPDYALLKPEILIAGNALAGASDPGETAKKMKELIS